MLDLRLKELPDRITVDGRTYRIKTDFRFWLDFERAMSNESSAVKKILMVFDDDLPKDNFGTVSKKLFEFYSNRSSTPKSTGKSSNEILVDFLEDGEYIYASFMEAYGIDLLEVDLHWWKFKALFNSLPDNSKIKQIMFYRGYKSSKESTDKRYQRAKKIWSLEQKDEKLDEINVKLNEEFYGAV